MPCAIPLLLLQAGRDDPGHGPDHSDFLRVFAAHGRHAGHDLQRLSAPDCNMDWPRAGTLESCRPGSRYKDRYRTSALWRNVGTLPSEPGGIFGIGLSHGLSRRSPASYAGSLPAMALPTSLLPCAAPLCGTISSARSVTSASRAASASGTCSPVPR